LNTGYLSYSGKRGFGGLSMGLGYLSTPMWSEKQASVGWGRRVWSGVGLGLRVGLNQNSFNKDEFILESTDDPLLSGSLKKTVPIVAASCVYHNPFSGLTLGCVIENPHQPNISPDGSDPNTVLPLTIRAGASVESERFQGSVNLSTNRFKTGLATQGRYFVFQEHALTAHFNQDEWSIGARFAVQENLWVDYSFMMPVSDLAWQAAGTHGFVVCFHAFERVEPPPEYNHRELVDETYSFRMPSTVAVKQPQAREITVPELTGKGDLYYLASEVDSTTIIVKRLTRDFAPDIDMNRVRALPRWRIGIMDSSWSKRVVHSLTDDMIPATPSNALPQGNYSSDYREQVVSLGDRLSRDNELPIKIVGDPTQLDRAKYIEEQILRRVEEDSVKLAEAIRIYQIQAPADSTIMRMLFRPVGEDSIPLYEEITLYEYDRIPFMVHFLGDESSLSEWSFQVADSDDRLVHAQSGRGSPPDTLWWDLCDQSGNKIDVDIFNYWFSWRSPDGAHYTLPAQDIPFPKHLMHKTLHFGYEQIDSAERGGAERLLILDPGHDGEVLIPTIPPDKPGNVRGSTEGGNKE